MAAAQAPLETTLTKEEARAKRACLTWRQAGLTAGWAAAQAPLEATLTDEEARRNSRRLDLLYLASSHPVAPDVFQLCDAAGAADEAARATLARPLDPQLSGARLLSLCALHFILATSALPGTEELWT